MTNTLTSLPSVERAVLVLLQDVAAPSAVTEDMIGGDFNFKPETMAFYIRVARAPGGRGSRLQGDVLIDIDVFALDYGTADSVALALEALLLGYPHVVEVDDRKVVLDNVYQNVGPSELPWDDDSTYRIGSTYSITVRRN